MIILFEILLLFCICAIINNVVIVAKYKKTSYYQITQKSYLSCRSDKGSFGEYLLYKNLKQLEKSGARFLFNCYLPRKNGETTEIDVLLIHKSGIYVFESKNYSGWIFGNEKSKIWTQTLPQGRGKKAHKEHFLNPIFQNNLHIECLKNYLQKEIPVYSVITFSPQCQLKKLEVKNPNYYVIHRNYSLQTVGLISSRTGDLLSEEEILEIFTVLYPCTQVSEQMKQQHIDDIHNHLDIENSSIQSKEACQKQQNIKSETSLNQDELICPRCGGNLILRQAKRGENKGKMFYGCSNFPKCRYIQNDK